MRKHLYTFALGAATLAILQVSLAQRDIEANAQALERYHSTIARNAVLNALEVCLQGSCTQVPKTPREAPTGEYLANTGCSGDVSCEIAFIIGELK